MYKGQLKNWNGKKGFGFIRSEELNQDTFIHISQLKSMSRQPKIGDVIYFDVEKQQNGKARAINSSIEGVAVKSSYKPTVRIEKSSSVKKICFSILAVIAIGIFAFERLNLAPSNDQEPLSLSSSHAVLDNNKSAFACDGRQHCSEMASLSEAKFFINHCPDTKMDGDNDGMPCESDSRF
ncbi:MAG: cold shock domain-containing protein [Gammaproteobacteria bacterium]|nr:cold shock domain-containing protein [Gammaproteobacteria bacterium]